MEKRKGEMTRWYSTMLIGEDLIKINVKIGSRCLCEAPQAMYDNDHNRGAGQLDGEPHDTNQYTTNRKS